MVVTRHPRVETLGYYWSRICAPGGRVFVSGLKSARGRASIDLVIEISFFDAPQARGTGAPSPRTSVRLPTRAPRAHHFCPNHSPGLQSWVVPALGHRCPKVGVVREGDGCDQTSQG